MDALNEKGMVSVIVPCYNQAIYLPEALNSLLAQTYQCWEAIVVNDGSPDETEKVALEYTRKDSRIRYVFKENGGLSSARNKGIELAQGEFILPLDADDIIHPEYMEKAMEAFEDNPFLKLVFCRGVFFGVKNKVWNLRYEGYEELLQRNHIFCSAFFRRSDCMAIGGYDENMRKGHEDWEFFIRLLDENSLVYQIPSPLFYYRVKEQSMITAAKQADVFNETEFYIYSKHRTLYASFFGGSALHIIRELLYLRKKREAHRNKWYRRFFRQYIKGLFHK